MPKNHFQVGSAVYLRELTVLHALSDTPLNKYLLSVGTWDAGPPPPTSLRVCQSWESCWPRDLMKVGLWESEGRCTCLSRPPPASEKVAVQPWASWQGSGSGGNVSSSVALPRLCRGPAPNHHRQSEFLRRWFAGFSFKIQRETQVLETFAEPRKASIHLTGPGRQVCGWTSQGTGARGKGQSQRKEMALGQLRGEGQTSENRPSSSLGPQS